MEWTILDTHYGTGQLNTSKLKNCNFRGLTYHKVGRLAFGCRALFLRDYNELRKLVNEALPKLDNLQIIQCI